MDNNQSIVHPVLFIVHKEFQKEQIGRGTVTRVGGRWGGISEMFAAFLTFCISECITHNAHFRVHRVAKSTSKELNNVPQSADVQKPKKCNKSS